MKHFKVSYEQRLWVDGHGYSTSRRFQDIYAKDAEQAADKWQNMRLSTQETFSINDYSKWS